MKKYLFAFLILLLACESPKNKYYSVIIYDDIQINGQVERKEKVDTLYVENDSLAIIQNFTSYAISCVLDEQMKKYNIKDYEITIDYKLINGKNEIVTNKKILTENLKSKIFNQIKEINNNSITASNGKPTTSDDYNSCDISEDFIKIDLKNPKTANFSMFDCVSEYNSDGTITVLKKVSAKNIYGVEKDFIYKLKLIYKGGNTIDINNWKLISIKSEEFR